MANVKKLAWTLGLKNHATGKYLTQEAFGHILNCNGPSLKKKQIFSLEVLAGKVHLKTHLGKFVYGTEAGKVFADADAPSAATVITIEPQHDGTWALKTAHGYYLHGQGDELTAFVKELPADGKWVPHLAMHPQVNMFNIGTQRFVRLDKDQLCANDNIPWGAEALVTIYFFEDHPHGRYGLVASNGSFLTASGRLSPTPTPDAQFLLGFHDDQISLRTEGGAYVTADGPQGVLHASKTTKAGMHGLFIIQDSEPQFVISTHVGKYFSARTSTELKGDQPTVSNDERFQLEVDDSGAAAFKTNKSKYWALGADGTVSCSAPAKSAATQFTVVYKHNKVAIQASNGKFLVVKGSGSVKAEGTGTEEAAQFTFDVINRPHVVLRGSHGFVALKGSRVECARARGDMFSLVGEAGTYSFQGANGKYWGLDVDGTHCSSTSKVPFYLEFPQRGKILIKTVDGAYLQGEQNGAIHPKGTAAGLNTLWEY